MTKPRGLKHGILFGLMVLLFFFFLGESVQAATKKKEVVKLVLQITVDGLRSDLIHRYQANFQQNGFQYLLKNGAVYENAHYLHANTETIVGHATLATGASPSDHGLIGNVWYDRKSGELAYNIEDPDATILPTRDNGEKAEQVDPAQKLSRTQGRSPSVMQAPAFADTLGVFNTGRSKRFGISGKDRGAIPMAGHTGKAFWYSTDTGDFITSAYYYDKYPEWVRSWNAQRKAEQYGGGTWQLLLDSEKYLLKDQDDRPYETDLKGFGRTFPHTFAPVGNPLLFTQLLISPEGDRLLLDFAKALITEEKVGQDEVTDYLSISFSAVDAVNHFFGASSLENEDVVLQLDRIIAELFKFIDTTVGLDQTLIVLSADHGNVEMPEYITELGFKVGRIYSEDVVEIANIIGMKLFKINELVHLFYRPFMYLDEKKILSAGLDISEVEQQLAAALTHEKGIALAFPRSGLTTVRAKPLLEQIKNNFHPSRSGNIYIAQEPYWFMFEKGPIAVMHGSPWKYDTHVPIIFKGPGIEPQKIVRRVHPRDMAGTMAAYLGMSPPASSSGDLLKEVLE